MITNVTRFACALLTGLSLLGCGSDDAAPPPGGVDAGTDADDTLNFAKVTKEVINELNCGGPLCHTGTAAGLRLASNDALHAELVGKMATGAECADDGITRVVPGDSASSLIYLKLTAPPCGDKMPPDPAMLSADKIDLVKQWIDEGAVK